MKARPNFQYLLLLGLLAFASGCGKEDDLPAFLVSNHTGFAVTLTSRTNGQTINIANNEEKKFKSTSASAIQLFSIASSQTQKRFDYRETGPNAYDLYSYEYDVEYRITGQGTVTSAMVSWANPFAGTNTNSFVLPASIAYRVYDQSYKYISARALQNGGCVTVSIYKKDQQGPTDTQCGYTVASASE